jgi:hypothetical protein
MMEMTASTSNIWMRWPVVLNQKKPNSQPITSIAAMMYKRLLSIMFFVVLVNIVLNYGVKGNNGIKGGV